MKKIMVDYESLDSAASRMEEENNQYMRNTEELMATVENLSASWQGKETSEFAAKVANYHADCRQLSMLCTQYIEFLRNSSRAYRETQDELAAQASHLA
ncbi:MAG: WXG100 family type VII secretion target [Erysipelotrichaceae bacterium]|jgi:WXG100 family type VII secretion target|nr:WXG100 family type VII secretion target [Erysipelotrichaceae bacterium]